MFLDRTPEAVPPAAPVAHPRRRAERVCFDMLARYAWRGRRGTAMVKDLTRHGARIEGIHGLTKGDDLTLLLPETRAVAAEVAWADGHSAGLAFDVAIPAARFDELVRHFATGRVEPLPTTILPTTILRNAPRLPRAA